MESSGATFDRRSTVTRVNPDQVKRAGVVGAGVIGSGWALHYLRMGLDVAGTRGSPGGGVTARLRAAQ